MVPEFASLVLEHFPAAQKGRVTWEKIERGGSDRDFFRARGLGGGGAFDSAIVARYGTFKAENARYARVAEFLGLRGVRVPRVFFHDPEQRLMALEDLGTTDLWSVREDPWEIRRLHYQSALEAVHAIHQLTAEDAERHGLPLEVAFDEALYRWEQDYFFDHCLGAALRERLDAGAVTELRGLPVWGEIANELAGYPRRLVHRDFQSQNILLHHGRAMLIDFQGLRAGLPEYDLASLLYDPYVQLTGSERAELLDFYTTLTPVVPITARRFTLCALQRLVQALGAYGFLGLQRGKPAFLAHIPAALASVTSLEIDGLSPHLAEVLGPALPAHV
ncbi:MAG: phosphotransferase [Verrucomicrobia bacterium]|nr:phosphotransferase [Verrucomicrobiota bacterium]